MTLAAASQTPTDSPDLDHKQMANAIRALAMDAVQKANSGHPGMPMGMADVATVLYSKFLKFNPKAPDWADRDRFILSAGHGSMLLYALNYLTGYEKMTLEEIKNFRQLSSITNGHPEVDVEYGIETTTGPLGQGISTAVGMALAERMMNARHGDDVMNHYTYVIASDGDLMEGISHEACSLAGHLNLQKLIVLYDDNGITIDGKTELSFTDDTLLRFQSYGWAVDSVDGHDLKQIEGAIDIARNNNKPTLIACRTKIGFGAPTKEGQSSSHGAPLGDDELAGAKKNLGWNHGPFEVPEDVLSMWRTIGAQHEETYSAWEEHYNSSRLKYELEESNEDFSEDLSTAITELKESFAAEKAKLATRKASGMVLDKLVPALPQLVGGSADLSGSNNTNTKSSTMIDRDNYGGNYINYGVREHGMAAIMNGLALHGGLIPYAGTFLQFSDYARPAIRLAALMKQQVIHVMTHDSIGLGEDGPTHQPVEHLAALRAIPNLYVFRPCDGIETAECWELALDAAETPSILSLSRQGVKHIRENSTENLSARGAYALKECDGAPDVTLFASGTEVEIALEAYETLTAEGHAVRLVSVPCMELFWAQDGDYIQNIVCNTSIKVAVEAAIRQPWDAFIGGHSPFIGMSGFGDSAPATDLYKHFGITAEAVVDAVKNKIK